jgi:S1-C subfamily serine protease
MRNVWAVFLAVFFAVFLIFPAARSQAQEQAWIQVETLPNLSSARTNIRRYAANLQDVNGFATNRGLYAIVIGPYSPRDALQVLQVYQADGLIPRDSYIAKSTDYKEQFWPVGANTLRHPATEPTADVTTTEPDVVAVVTPPEPEFTQESKREALASESLLSREQRKELQVALKWAGFYDGAIDGAYGRGTRGSMSGWQARNSFNETGVLTTFQRSELMRQYNSVFEGLGLEVMRDNGAGIAMILPLKLVKFDKYEPPFVHYSPVGSGQTRVLMISQQGDKATLAGLYDIMQTLEIVPPEGPRENDGKAFTLVGENAQIVSHTQAWLEGDVIKGFTLVWPAGDEARRTRVLTRMLASFERIDGVLDPAAGSNEDQRIDLVAGLEIRQPKLSRSGFYVDKTGTVVTTDEVVGSCSRITIDEDFEAEMVAHDAGLGIAVLRPKEPLAPLSIAAFQRSVPRLQSDIAVAGYSYGGILGAPTMTFGQLADLRGLNGEPGMKRLALAALDGDAGGPVIDAGGAVLGMLMSGNQGGRQLPDGVRFAAGADVVQQLLQQAGITADETSELNRIPPETLTRQATDMTVLVSCWE